MEPGGLWWTNVLNSALPPQRLGLTASPSTKSLLAIRLPSLQLLPKSTSSIWDDSLSIQVFHRCRYIKLIVEI